MVGLPGQTLRDLAGDIRFFKELNANMIGMGPYITEPDTPVAGERGHCSSDTPVAGWGGGALQQPYTWGGCRPCLMYLVSSLPVAGHENAHHPGGPPCNHPVTVHNISPSASSPVGPAGFPA